MNCLRNQRSPTFPGINFGSAVNDLRSKDLRLCVSEKEGGFVVLDSGRYVDKGLGSHDQKLY